MPLNKNALIRYKTIDKCLQNRYRRWTLEDLIDACTDALYEYEGINRRVGTRTIQADIQIMRSDKLGYNAPIKVIDRKYYTYEDPDYSITNIPLTDQDLEKLTEVTEILKQFKGFSHFSELSVMVQKLEDKVHAEKAKQKPVIDIEKNENLKGLEYLEGIYQAISKKQVLNIWYQSFRAKRPGKIILHPYLLKEYRNRWFVLGRKGDKQPIITLALDRIHEIEVNTEKNYIEDSEFAPDEYYKNIIGVIVNSNRPTNVHLFVDKENAPYIITKPLHHSQQLISETDKGVEIAIKVIPNFELEREILGFGDSIEVISPKNLREKIHQKLVNAVSKYSKDGNSLKKI
jgi:predicted DNA-binding transcriptional regulator YafY